jgi:hypothetical protein
MEVRVQVWDYLQQFFPFRRQRSACGFSDVRKSRVSAVKTILLLAQRVHHAKAISVQKELPDCTDYDHVTVRRKVGLRDHIVIELRERRP